MAEPTPDSSTLLELLGERWFTIPARAWSHPVVQRFRESRTKFVTVHAGRRSFKTELAKRRLVSEACQNPRKRYCFGGPTRAQAKAIAWKDLKALTPFWATARIRETELSIELKNGSEICVVGFDRPERFEGSPWHGVVMTEFPHFDEFAWDESILPALRDTGGWAILEGVPQGRNHYYDLCEYARRANDPEWEDFCWKTIDVRNLAEIENDRRRMDERTFRQEYEGSFESYEGRAYLYYDPETHRRTTKYNPSFPVCIACDFNLDPCIWLLGQDIRSRICVFDEIVQRQTDIWKMCAELKRRLALLGVKSVEFYGDFEHGQARSVSATASSWTIIRQEFDKWSVRFHLKPHPAIVDRVNAVNSKLRNVQGEAMLQLDPACVELHKDLDGVDFEMLKKQTDVGDRTHASDALGYWINYVYPVVPSPTMEAI